MSVHSMFNSFNKPTFKSFSEMNCSDAEEYFNWFISVKKQRIDTLFEFIKDRVDNKFVYNYSEETLKALYKTIKLTVNKRDLNEAEVAEAENKYFIKFKGDIKIPSQRLDEQSVALCFDIGMCYGDILIHNVTGAKWSFNCKSDKFIDKNKPILIKEGKKNSINPIRVIEVVSLQVIDDKIKEQDLLKMFQYTLATFK